MTEELSQVESERRELLLKKFQESDWYKEKLVTRLKVQDACNRSSEARIFAYSACKKDPVFFINNFCYTPNDKYKQYHFPFILYEFQEEYLYWLLDHIRNGKDGLVEKSREMGVTWINMCLFLWMWLFDENFNALIGSYKEKLVDDRGNKDSLFGMLDYNLNTLPKWLLPKRFNPDKHRTGLKLLNPENQNIIKGDTMNPQFGRGGRKTLIFMDEGAFWEYFQDAWTACGDTTNCRITVSTPNGYNAFAVLRESGIDVHTLKWNMHPLKDRQWYEYEGRRRLPEEMAQEIDISYLKSQRSRVYPEWDNVEFGLFPYLEEYPLYVSWDFGKSDDTAIIWWQKIPNQKIRIVDVYWNSGKTIDFYVPFITGIMPSDGYKYSKSDFQIIEEHKRWSRGTHFGDPAGRFSNQVVDATVLDVLRNNGIIVNFRDEWKYFKHRISASRLLMRDNLVVNQNGRTRYLNVCMVNSRFPDIKRGGIDITNSKDLKPIHDQYSHLRSAFEYGALGLSEFKKTNSIRIYDQFPRKER